MLKVKKLCRAKGITLRTLAEKMDIAPESLNRMISSSGNPTLSSIIGMAKALNVEVYKLIEDFEAEKSVRGFIEVGDEIFKINSIADLTDLYKKLTS